MQIFSPATFSDTPLFYEIIANSRQHNTIYIERLKEAIINNGYIIVAPLFCADKIHALISSFLAMRR